MHLLMIYSEAESCHSEGDNTILLVREMRELRGGVTVRKTFSSHGEENEGKV